jgi:hypothetical protein
MNTGVHDHPFSHDSRPSPSQPISAASRVLSERAQSTQIGVFCCTGCLAGQRQGIGWDCWIHGSGTARLGWFIVPVDDGA